MKVLQITRDYASNGGIGRYVQDLTGALEQAHHDVAVVCGDGSEGERGAVSVVTGCDEFEHPDAPANRLAVLERASAFAPDLVLVHAMDDYGLEALLRERYRVARFVHNHLYCPSGIDHDTASLRGCERAQGRACVSGYVTRRCWHIRQPATAARFYRRTAAAVASVRTAPLLFTASQYVRGRLLRHGVDPRRIRVAPYFAGVPGAGVHTPPRRPAGNTLLYVGRIVPEKGIGYLLRAMPQLNARARLIINGDGPARPEMAALAQRLGIDNRVEFLGWTCREALLTCYEQADVVVVPSVWPEPFGLVGIEAMAYAKPVVAFRSGAIPEWLADGETGYALDRGDVAGLARRTEELLADPVLRLRMGRAGYERVAREFSRERHLAAIRDGLVNATW
jgi:glycosyltransferase involved in cell wall biosynthesis